MAKSELSLKERIVLLQEADNLVESLDRRITSLNEDIKDSAQSISDYEEQLHELDSDSKEAAEIRRSIEWQKNYMEDYANRRNMLHRLADIILNNV